MEATTRAQLFAAIAGCRRRCCRCRRSSLVRVPSRRDRGFDKLGQADGSLRNPKRNDHRGLRKTLQAVDRNATLLVGRQQERDQQAADRPFAGLDRTYPVGGVAGRAGPPARRECPRNRPAPCRSRAGPPRGRREHRGGRGVRTRRGEVAEPSGDCDLVRRRRSTCSSPWRKSPLHSKRSRRRRRTRPGDLAACGRRAGAGFGRAGSLEQDLQQPLSSGNRRRTTVDCVEAIPGLVLRDRHPGPARRTDG